MKPSLIVIDIQNWFFRTPNRRKIIPKLIKNTNKLIDFFHKNRLHVIHVLTVFKKDKSQGDIIMKKYNRNVLVSGTKSATELKDLKNYKNDTTIRKTRHSAFVRTNFEQYLRKNGIDTLILAGVFIDGCIGLTAIDAYERDFKVILAKDAVFGTRLYESKSMLKFVKKEFEITAMPNSKIFNLIKKSV